MSLTILSNNSNAFSCPYVFKSAFKIAFNKFFVCITVAPFYIDKVEEREGVAEWKNY